MPLDRGFLQKETMLDSHIQLMYNFNMIRTQIYIPQPLHRQLLHIAHKRGRSMAQMIREFITSGLEQNRGKDDGGKKTIANLLNIKSSAGPKDLSKNLDHYLYSEPPK